MFMADDPAAAPLSTADMLALVQWLSPAFPTGAFAWSHGLEQIIAAGEVRDGPALLLWLEDILTHGAGWTDAVLIAAALRPDADLDDLCDLARALAASAERLAESEAQGAAFAAAQGAFGATPPPRPLPIAFAEAARRLRAPVSQMIALYLHAFAANLVSAAVRFMPLGQTEGQGVLAALNPLIERLAGTAAVSNLDDLSTSAFRADMAAMRHETLDVRLFRS